MKETTRRRKKCRKYMEVKEKLIIDVHCIFFRLLKKTLYLDTYFYFFFVGACLANQHIWLITNL